MLKVNRAETMAKEQENDRNHLHRECICISRKIYLIVFAAIVGTTIGFLGTWFGLQPRLISSNGRKLSSSQSPRSVASRPNFIIFLADDTGYGDFRTFGHPNQERTGVDRMADEGMIFTHLYTPAAVCSPSRAAILTGRYPIRTGIFGRIPLFGPTSSGGLPRREITIAEALKQNGYVTGMTGKWHLGINKENGSDGFHLPRNHGFDAVNTIIPLTQTWFCKQHKPYVPAMSEYCFLYKNSEIVEQPINLGSLTSKLLSDTINFINKHKDQPFFYLMSFPQTHAALFSDRRFAGKSKRGPYGDNVNEMGWAINEVLDHTTRLGIDSETLVLFLSDHGAVRDGCGEGGSNGPFRGGKATTWEGGVRVPAAAWWPGVIEPGGVSHSVLSTLDLFPTILELATHRKSIINDSIDGVSFVDEIIRSKNSSRAKADRPLFFYCSDMLTAARYHNYKIHYYTNDRFVNDMIREHMPHCVFDDTSRVNDLAKAFTCQNIFHKQDPPLVFDVESDIGEHIFIDPESQRHRDVIEEMKNIIKAHEASIETVEAEMDRPVLSYLQPCCDPPTCMCNFED